MATINLEVMRRELNNGVAKSNAVRNLAFASAKRSFEVEKRILLGNFKNHPVTLEMEAGPDTTDSVLPYGNLYSLLGFEKGKDLTSSIEDKLNNDVIIVNPNFKPTIRGTNIKYIFQGKIPPFTEIEKDAPKPDEWGTKSWIRYIEEGIPNFAYYLFSAVGFPAKLNSRSQHGLEISKVIRSQTKTNKIPYIKDLLNNFRSKLITKFTGRV